MKKYTLPLILLPLLLIIAASGSRLSAAWQVNRSFREMSAALPGQTGSEAEGAHRRTLLDSAHARLEDNQTALSERQSRYLAWLRSLDPLSGPILPPSIEDLLRALAPSLPLDLEVAPGLALEGLDLHEDDFIAGGLRPVAFFWRVAPFTDQDLPAAAGDTLSVDARQLTLASTANQVVNPGFERPARWQVGVPPGYTQVHTSQLVEPYTIETMQRNGRETTVACVTNTARRRRGGLASANIPAQPHQIYVAGGWVHPAGAGGGRVLVADWRGSAPTALPLSAQREVGDWQLVYGLVQPTSERIQLWSDNFESTGKVCFDNLFLFPLTLPESAQAEN